MNEAINTSSVLTDNDLFYLRLIKRNLEELRMLSHAVAEATGYGVANAALDDNLNWLDCFIDMHERWSRKVTE